MLIPKQTPIPALVRVKPGALDRMGIYAERHELMRVLLFFSQDLDQGLMARLLASFRSQNIQVLVFWSRRPCFEIHGSDRLENGIPRHRNSGR